MRAETATMLALAAMFAGVGFSCFAGDDAPPVGDLPGTPLAAAGGGGAGAAVPTSGTIVPVTGAGGVGASPTTSTSVSATSGTGGGTSTSTSTSTTSSTGGGTSTSTSTSTSTTSGTGGGSPDGMPCGAAAQCQSNHCVDGVCCETSCAGNCMTCLGNMQPPTAQDGHCGPVKGGQDPRNDCFLQAGCGQTGFCDGAGFCAMAAAGTQCAPAQCVNGTTLSNADTCNGSGACQDNGTQSCGLYTCENDACNTSCVNDTDCSTAAYCEVPACVPKKGNGALCDSGNECISNHCTDGVCCNAVCGQTCESCLAAVKGNGQDGDCGFVNAGTDPENECAPTGSSTCGTTGNCDGAGLCQLHPNGTICAAASCNGTTLSLPDLCDGDGLCVDGGTQNCDPAPCSVDVCAFACTSDGQCGAGAYCNGTVCAAKKPLGSDCAGANECLTSFCADSKCCDKACEGGVCEACSVAAGAPVDGTCTPLNGNTCDDGDPCTEGDACAGGACQGTEVSCSSVDACHDPGSCQPATGECSVGTPTQCPTAHDCEAPLCDPAAGCATVLKFDGAPCKNDKGVAGICIAGSCFASHAAESGAGGAGGTEPGAGAGGDPTGGGGHGGTSAAPDDVPIVLEGGCSTGRAPALPPPFALAVGLLSAIGVARRRRRGLEKGAR